MELKQKNWPEYRYFEIVPEGLKTEYKTHQSTVAKIHPFEEIGFEEILENHKPGPLVILLGISIFINIIFLILTLKTNNQSAALIPPLVIVIYALTWRKWMRIEQIKFLKGNIFISFWYSKKNSLEVDNFIHELKNAKRNFMRNKYFKIEDFTAIEIQKNRFIWLLNQGYITESELKEIVPQLEKRTIIRGF